MKTTIESTDSKFYCVIAEREPSTRFPNHKFSVVMMQRTPKGKWSKEKVIFNFVWKTWDEAIAYANEKIDTINARITAKNELKAKNKTILASDFYKVEDIICNTWGYEQTNINFYQVIEVKPRTILVKEIGNIAVEGSEGFMSCDVVPDINGFLVDGRQYLLRVKDGGRLSSPESYHYMHKWSGHPMYRSWYA